jgi:hypothetical protein
MTSDMTPASKSTGTDAANSNSPGQLFQGTAGTSDNNALTDNGSLMEPRWPLAAPVGKTGIGWLDEVAEALISDFGLAPHAAALLPLAAIGAAVGPACWAGTPEALAVCPQFNIAFVGRPGSRVRDAVRMFFTTPCALVKDARARQQARGIDEIQQEITGLLAHLCGARADGKESVLSSDGMALLRSCVEARPKQPERSAKDDAESWQKIRDLSLLLRPDLVTEDTDLRRLLSPRQMAFDGVVTSLSLDGAAVPRLRAASRSLLMETASLAARVWQPQFRRDQQHEPGDDYVARLWVLRESDTAEMLADDSIRRSGLCGSMLFADASSGGPLKCGGGLPPESAWDDFTKTALQCWYYRLSGHQALLSLSVDAMVKCYSFIESRCQRLVELGMLAEGLPEHLPTLLVKLAQLLHIARHQGAGDAWKTRIDTTTINTAARLADALIASHLDIVVRHGHPRTHGHPKAVSSEIELVTTRLLVRGPLPFRDLMRSLHRVNARELERMLAAAMAAGAVAKEGDRFKVVDV